MPTSKIFFSFFTSFASTLFICKYLGIYISAYITKTYKLYLSFAFNSQKEACSLIGACMYLMKDVVYLYLLMEQKLHL